MRSVIGRRKSELQKKAVQKSAKKRVQRWTKKEQFREEVKSSERKKGSKDDKYKKTYGQKLRLKNTSNSGQSDNQSSSYSKKTLKFNAFSNRPIFENAKFVKNNRLKQL